MGELKAAAGFVDLEPRVGQWMSGYAARIYPAEGTHDPITARALVLDDGNVSLAIIVCDLISLEETVVREIRRLIHAKCGIPEGNILIGCTHTHSGPASQAYRGVLGTVDEGWLEQVKLKVANLVASLPDKVQPATFRYAQAKAPGIGANRQDSSRGIDDEVTVIGIDSVDGEAIATLVNFGCHSVVLGGDNLLFSADYPGAMIRSIERRLGGLSMFLQGTIGDVNPAKGHGSFDLVEEVGTDLADAALAALENAPCTSDVALGVVSDRFDTPLEPALPPEELDRLEAEYRSAREQYAQSGDRVNEGVMEAYLQWIENTRAVLATGPAPSSVPGELMLLRMNDLLIAAAPFELYSDIGIAIKDALKPWKVAYMGCANGQLGYLPTEWAKDQGGYGPQEAYKWFLNIITPPDRTAGPALVARMRALASRCQ